MHLLHTVTLVLCLSTALSLSIVRQSAETATNEKDKYSVIGLEPASTEGPGTEDVQPTGSFGHTPQENFNNNNNDIAENIGKPSGPPLVIVKLLQPIVLPVVKTFNPEGGERDPDFEKDDTLSRYITNSFQKSLNSGPLGKALGRSVGQNIMSFEDKTDGLHLLGDKKDGLNIYGDNSHIAIQLH